MARPSPSFDQLPEEDQKRVRIALERCTYRYCESTLDSIAADILRARLRRRAAKLPARIERTEIA